MLNRLSGIKIGILALIVLLVLMVLGLAYSAAQAQVRDRHRLIDIQKIHDALKIFFEENGYYPYGTGTGEPTGLSNYLDGWPVSPKSAACPNNYSYAQKAQGNSYELVFCLDHGGVSKVNP
jgi:hypothetical protein